MFWDLFRTPAPQKLTLPLIKKLSSQSDLSPSEVERWYQQFIFCYTCGYISFNEFVVHVKQLYVFHSNQTDKLSKAFLRQLFSKLDIDRDGKLNFEEFFRFNILINHGNENEKLKFILTFFNTNKDVHFTQEKLIEFFINSFYLFNLTNFIEYIPENIRKVLSSIHIHMEHNQISWNEFTSCILNHSDLFETFVSTTTTTQSQETTFL